MDAAESLIDYFCVVGVADGAQEASIVDRYPQEDLEEHPLSPAVALGVDEGGKSEAEREPRFYCFVLTNVDGQRSYGSCLAFYERAKRGYQPKVLCFVARWPFFSLHKALLSELYHVCVAPGDPAPAPAPTQDKDHRQQRRTSAAVLRRLSAALPLSSPYAALGAAAGGGGGGCFRLPVERLLACVVRETPVMPPGSELSLTLFQSSVSYARRPLSGLPHVDDACFEILFQCLRAEHVVQLLECMLVEQRVLLHSQHNGTLAAVTEALLALMFPFCWYHVYVPSLPLSLIDYLEVPVPFVIGMHTLCLSTRSAMDSISSCVLVHLDADKIVTPMTVAVGAGEEVDSVPELPAQFRAPLVARLRACAPAPVLAPVQAAEDPRLARRRAKAGGGEAAPPPAPAPAPATPPQKPPPRRSRFASLQRQASETLDKALSLFDAPPPEPYHEYTVTFGGGPLGLVLESTHRRLIEDGSFDGRKHRSFDASAVVKGYQPLPGGEKGPAERSGLVGPGSYLVAINGESTLELTFKQTIAALRAAERPLTLRFQNGRRGELPVPAASPLPIRVTRESYDAQSHWVDEVRAAFLEVFCGLLRDGDSADTCPADWRAFLGPFSQTQAFINFSNEVAADGAEEHPEFALWHAALRAAPGDETLALVARQAAPAAAACSPRPLNEDGIDATARFRYDAGTFPPLRPELFAAREPPHLDFHSPLRHSSSHDFRASRAHSASINATSSLSSDRPRSMHTVKSRSHLLSVNSIEPPRSSLGSASAVSSVAEGSDSDSDYGEDDVAEVLIEQSPPARPRATMMQRLSRALRSAPSAPNSPRLTSLQKAVAVMRG